MTSHDLKDPSKAEGSPTRQPWEPMTLTYLGHVGDLLQARENPVGIVETNHFMML